MKLIANGYQMKFKDKIISFHCAMERRDIPVNRVDPPVFKFVRLLGIKLKPPIFSSIAFNVITFLLVSVAFSFIEVAPISWTINQES